MDRIRKGDEVVVIAGRDKGKRGTVLRRLDEERVLVEGVNRVKKNQRPNPMKNQQGGIIDRDMPVDVSNVMLVHKGKTTRVGYKIQSDGSKVRVAKRTGEVIG